MQENQGQETPATPQPAMEEIGVTEENGGGRRKLLKIVGIVVGILLVVLLAGFFVLRFFLEKQPAKQVVELTYWGFWLDEEKIKPLLLEYEAKTGVKVNYVKQAKQDYRERLTSQLARGNGPDIFSFHNSWVPMFKNHLSTLPFAIMGTETFQDTFYPTAVSDLVLGEGYIGIPLQFDGLALFVNEDIFTQGAKAYPQTWDEFRKIASELTERDKDSRILRAGAALGTTENVDHWQDILGLMLLQGGIDPGKPDPVTSFQVFDFYTLFDRTDRVWDNTLPVSTQAFVQGKLAMYFGPSWKVNEIKRLNPSLSFKVIPVPQLPKLNMQDRDVNGASYWAEGVWNKSPHTKEAWELLKFLSSKESLSRFSGFPYSRRDMADLQKDDPFLGAYILEVPTARSWYLAGETYDGQTGINTRLSSLYSQALATILNKGSKEDAIEALGVGVKSVLSEYGL